MRETEKGVVSAFTHAECKKNAAHILGCAWNLLVYCQLLISHL